MYILRDFVRNKVEGKINSEFCGSLTLALDLIVMPINK